MHSITTSYGNTNRNSGALALKTNLTHLKPSLSALPRHKKATLRQIRYHPEMGGRPKMKNNNQIEKEAGRIADEIVRLVERTNGPVTLVQVRREIPGFAALE